MVAEAVRAAEEAEGMTAAVRQQQAAIRRTYQLAELQVSHCMFLDRRTSGITSPLSKHSHATHMQAANKTVSILCSLMDF